MRPLLAIISSLHSLGIVHRDIKPENIFINTGGQIQLGDFGLAACKHYDRMTERVGTLDYMAPEVRGGRERCCCPRRVTSPSDGHSMEGAANHAAAALLVTGVIITYPR
jgi:serine/threonine protein kinase